MHYIWQKEDWTNFRWDTGSILTALSLAKSQQGYILGQADSFELKDKGDLITEEALSTSAIEGELLDRDSIRSSVARRLGLPTAGMPDPKKGGDGLVDVLIDATRNYYKILTPDRLWAWQAGLFPTGYSGLFKIKTGGWRTGSQPMRVVSGSMGREVVHFEAPPSGQVIKEMDEFFKWWNSPVNESDGIIRAAIAHFRFVTIHPFEDGNGRISRALTDMALAQDEKTDMRLYSLSSQIIKDKSKYYRILEKTQKGRGDITEWLIWFLTTFEKSIENSKRFISKALFLGQYFISLSDIHLRDRQLKVLKKMLERYPEEFQGGLTNRKYVVITKVSSETAKRDLKEMVDKGVIIP
ncbi:MAG: Fic family protein, partial [Spirochaetaceae bacterium]|nr:Fic family protein [Spirochaetaceae bacterium]